jgi:hypothetical protein
MAMMINTPAMPPKIPRNIPTKLLELSGAGEGRGFGVGVDADGGDGQRGPISNEDVRATIVKNGPAPSIILLRPARPPAAYEVYIALAEVAKFVSGAMLTLRAKPNGVE